MKPTAIVARAYLGLAALAAVAVAAAVAAAVAGCSSSGPVSGGSPSESTSRSMPVAPPSLASTTAGSLVITGGYIPAPASPDVAAAYLTITNNSAAEDTLTKVASSITGKVMAMTETDRGGVGSMTDLASVTIPAYGSMQFVPNHAHLMLENPPPLKPGDQVTLSLTFAHAGTVRITLPVIALTQVPTGSPTT